MVLGKLLIKQCLVSTAYMMCERPIQEIDGKSEESAALALSGHLGIFCRCSSIFLTTLSKFGQCTVTFGNYNFSMSPCHQVIQCHLFIHLVILSSCPYPSVWKLVNLSPSNLLASELAHLGACF